MWLFHNWKDIANVVRLEESNLAKPPFPKPYSTNLVNRSSSKWTTLLVTPMFGTWSFLSEDFVAYLIGIGLFLEHCSFHQSLHC